MRRKIIFLTLFLFIGCLGTEPKELGKNQHEDLFSGGSSATDRFLLNFAYKTASSRSILLQGAVDSAATFISTCNYAGTGCACDLLIGSGDTNPTVAENGNIQYETDGNYFTCTIPASVADPDDINFVRLRNIGNTKKTDIYLLYSTLTLAQILGELEKTKVRTVSRYRCLYNYLVKTGTTATTFDCSNPTGGNDLNIDTVSTHHYLYADNSTNNYKEKAVDIFYGGGRICSMSLKQYDCNVEVVIGSGDNTPVVDFGLYSESSGQFTHPVALSAKPSGGNTNFGYAAPTSTGASDGVCPPGLSKYQAYTVTAARTADSNMPATLTDTRAMISTAPVTNLTVSVYDGGDCNGTDTCTAPDTTVAPASTTDTAFVAPATAYCVIPGTLLPP